MNYALMGLLTNSVEMLFCRILLAILSLLHVCNVFNAVIFNLDIYTNTAK